MWQDLGGLSGVGVNSVAHQVDQFGTTELSPEQQKILLDIKRRKNELVLEIQTTLSNTDMWHASIGLSKSAKFCCRNLS
ncbi:hypothetical protein HN011_007506 [Eciton burchellii]|nr:hypothetical protein HN011_007506 [Eciton burchellii]